MAKTVKIICDGVQRMAEKHTPLIPGETFSEAKVLDLFSKNLMWFIAIRKPKDGDQNSTRAPWYTYPDEIYCDLDTLGGKCRASCNIISEKGIKLVDEYVKIAKGKKIHPVPRPRPIGPGPTLWDKVQAINEDKKPEAKPKTTVSIKKEVKPKPSVTKNISNKSDARNRFLSANELTFLGKLAAFPNTGVDLNINSYLIDASKIILKKGWIELKNPKSKKLDYKFTEIGSKKYNSLIEFYESL